MKKQNKTKKQKQKNKNKNKNKNKKQKTQYNTIQNKTNQQTLLCLSDEEHFNG